MTPSSIAFEIYDNDYLYIVKLEDTNLKIFLNQNNKELISNDLIQNVFCNIDYNNNI